MDYTYGEVYRITEDCYYLHCYKKEEDPIMERFLYWGRFKKKFRYVGWRSGLAEEFEKENIIIWD